MSTYTNMAPKTLKGKHLDMLLLDATGASVKTIAEATGYSPDMVYCVRQSPVYQERLARLREYIQTECINLAVEKLNRASLKAVEVLEHALDNPETPLRQKLLAAHQVLKFVTELGGTPSRPSTTPKAMTDLIARLDYALENSSERVNEPIDE
jgi:hypothetical protein